MTLDEFLANVAAEPARSIERDVVLAPAGLVARIASSGGMSLPEFISESRKGVSERRTTTLGHVLGEPASEAAVHALQARIPGFVMPADLRALVMRFNGIHLWADLADGRSYEGLAPINEWELASAKLGPNPTLSGAHILISYHSDSSAFVVFNADRKIYFLMDSAAPDERSPIGGHVDELLDWLWDGRIYPESG